MTVPEDSEAEEVEFKKKEEKKKKRFCTIFLPELNNVTKHGIYYIGCMFW